MVRFPGRVAQLVEQGIENPRVGGSIPSPATIYKTLPRLGFSLMGQFFYAPWKIVRIVLGMGLVEPV